MARNKNKGKGRNKGGGGGGGNKNKGRSGGGSQKPQSPPPSSPSRRQQAKAAANMSVQQRRTAAKEAGVGLKDFKAGRTGANAVARRDAQREANRSGQGNQQGNQQEQQQQTQGNTFKTAAGYEMEKGAYNTRSKEMMDKYKTDNPNAGMSKTEGDNASFDEDGYLSYDSTKPQWQANDMLKEAGYKAGDMLWKPGAKDDLNGRTLTGRIARVTENGNYIPEYEHDAVNSSHRSTGNAGYAGEVGLGADQAAYNRQYEQDNDVTTGQVNQQLEANGFDTKQNAAPDGNQYAEAEQGNTPAAQQANNYSVMPNMRLPANPTSESAAHNSQTNLWNSNHLFKNKGLGMDFSFNPGKFMQGQ